jgi:hypothetical protein
MAFRRHDFAMYAAAAVTLPQPCRYGWDCGCSLLKGMLTLGGGNGSGRSLRSVTSDENPQRRDREMTGRDEVLGVTTPASTLRDGSDVTRVGHMLRRLRSKALGKKGSGGYVDV